MKRLFTAFVFGMCHTKKKTGGGTIKFGFLLIQNYIQSVVTFILTKRVKMGNEVINQDQLLVLVKRELAERNMFPITGVQREKDDIYAWRDEVSDRFFVGNIEYISGLGECFSYKSEE